MKSLALVFTRHQQAFCSMGLTSARFCQQMCEIPSPCFKAVFTGLLLDHSSLPPDFARGFVQSRALALTRYVQFFCSVTASRFPPPDFASRELKSLALVLMRYLQAFCSITAHFRQILPVDLYNPEPCIHAARAFLLLGDGFTVPSARFCQQRAEIPSPCFNAVFTGFARSQLTSARFCPWICAIPSPCIHAVRAVFLLGEGFTAPSGRFCQQMCEIPSPCFNAVFTGLLLGHSSFPPDFASGFV